MVECIVYLRSWSYVSSNAFHVHLFEVCDLTARSAISGSYLNHIYNLEMFIFASPYIENSGRLDISAKGMGGGGG